MSDKLSFKIDPHKIRKGIRDDRIKDMITSTGGVVRVFKDKKKACRYPRKAKYKKEMDHD